ncbi:MAG: hypothetical protein Fur005_36920 [Roseiflexaceae bacterium]
MPTWHSRNEQDDDREPIDDGDQEEAPAIERIRRNTGKNLSAKQDRRQQDKAWGKMINKNMKDRKRKGGMNKP